MEERIGLSGLVIQEAIEYVKDRREWRRIVGFGQEMIQNGTSCTRMKRLNPANKNSIN